MEIERINNSPKKVFVCCAANQGAMDRGFDAGKIASALAKNFGGGGGGKPDFAQGGFTFDGDEDLIESQIREFVLNFVKENQECSIKKD